MTTDPIDVEYRTLTEAELLGEPVEADELLSEADAVLGSDETEECLWCRRVRDVVLGSAAIAIGLLFVLIGIDLASNGALTARLTYGGTGDNDG